MADGAEAHRDCVIAPSYRNASAAATVTATGAVLVAAAGSCSFARRAANAAGFWAWCCSRRRTVLAI